MSLKLLSSLRGENEMSVGCRLPIEEKNNDLPSMVRRTRNVHKGNPLPDVQYIMDGWCWHNPVLGSSIY